MEEFLKSLGITAKGTYSKSGAYIIDIQNYDEYGMYFSLLEKSDIEEVQDTSQITVHTTNITFANDDYQIVLQADLDEDIYKLIVTEY